MAGNAPLTQFLGTPVILCASTSSTDADSASDFASNGVPIAGASGILFIEIWPAATDVIAGATKWHILYSCDANASNAAASNAGGWTNTDCSFRNATDATYTPDSDSRISIVDLDLTGWEAGAFSSGANDKDGMFFCGQTGLEGSTDHMVIIGIPYGMNLSPSTASVPHKVATSTSISR